MAALRLALPESLRAAVAAVRGLGTAPRLLSLPVPTEERNRLRWQRLWRERRAGCGASGEDAAAALQNASVRALLAVYDRQADAALLDENDGAAARQLLEPRHGLACGELWIAGEPAARASGFGWWSGSLEPVSQAVEQLRAAVETWAELTQRRTQAVVVGLAGGEEAGRAERMRFAQTVAERMPAQSLVLYSPLFFRNGELQLDALLAAVRKHCGDAAPVLCVPHLTTGEIGAAVNAAGMPWAGPIFAGADAPAAQLYPGAAPARVQATCDWLLRDVQAPVATLGRMK